MCENPMIREAELTGGRFEPPPCPCGEEDCNCRQRYEEEQENIAEDERLWK